MAAQIQKTKKLQLFKSMLSLINWDFQMYVEQKKNLNNLKIEDSLWFQFL